MDAETLKALKAFGHVDYDDDDAELTRLYRAAVAYLDGAGIPADGSELHQQAAFLVTMEWYDAGQVGPVTVGTRQLINQLKLDPVGMTGYGL